MQVAFFSSKPYDRQFFEASNAHHAFDLHFIEARLDEDTVPLAENAEAVCVFVNDRLPARVIEKLASAKTKIIALRCAGFNNVDLKAAASLGIPVVRVPAYSPHAVAEHALAMIMTLNRKTHKAYNRVREQNFELQGLLGFDLFKKTVGVIGTGNIGKIFARIMAGIGCNVLLYDVNQNPELRDAGMRYVQLPELLAQSDIVSLHCPLNESTRYLINPQTLASMKDKAMLINTSRGGLIDTKAVIAALKSGKISALGIDVYEQEEKLFFQNLTAEIIQDDVISRLLTFPNVLITAHQGFFTQEALSQIAETTLASLQDFKNGKPLTNQIT